MTDDPARPTTTLLMMCPPDHYEVGYAINPWMDPEGWSRDPVGNQKLAQEEWQALKSLYESLGAAVIEEPAVEDLPDLVFASNAGFALDKKMLLAHFRNPERQGEEQINARFFEECRRDGTLVSVDSMPADVFFEGGGDAVFDKFRNLIWLGHGQRSSFEAKEILERTFGLKIVDLPLISADFYHLDTALAPLPRGHIMYVPRAFDEETIARIKEVAGNDTYLIPLSEEESGSFCANAVALRDHIVLGACSDQLRGRLEEFGYQVHTTPLPRFLMGGGAAYCLTCRLDHRTGG